MSPITDPDVRILASLADAIAEDYAESETNPWSGSPFEWILKKSSRTKGAIAESLVSGWCAAKGFDVTRSPNSDADRIINHLRIEIKFSTLWKSGVFKFQQIRDQDYDFLFCLGVMPFDARAWLIPKEALYQHVIGHLGQHTGANAVDTAWLSFQSDNAPDWLSPYGGRLSEVFRILKAAEPRTNH